VRRFALLLLLVAGCAAMPPAEIPAERAGLYRAMETCLGEASPTPSCLTVDRGRGFVLLKDRDPAKPYGYLIVPDRAVTGIEDPRALRPPVADLWRYGWAAGAELLPAPPSGRGLAINSKAGRSQDLLHIHISCVRDDVRAELASVRLAPGWAPEPVLLLEGRAWNARRVARLDPSPFLRLTELPGAAEDMGAQSLAVFGLPDGGFALLADATEPGAPGDAEELLDQDC
jgi:CDP-diacylglycerol pyrophosphatase